MTKKRISILAVAGMAIVVTVGVAMLAVFVIPVAGSTSSGAQAGGWMVVWF